MDVLFVKYLKFKDINYKSNFYNMVLQTQLIQFRKIFDKNNSLSRRKQFNFHTY